MSFNLQGTVEIQGESLRQFMAQLGYRPARPNGGWYTDNETLAGNRILSTRTAIKLHNLQREEWQEIAPGWYGVPQFNLNIAISPYMLNKLQAAKIVKQVKFTPVRKAINGVRMPVDLNANLIKVVDEVYWNMLGIEKE